MRSSTAAVLNSRLAVAVAMLAMLFAGEGVASACSPTGVGQGPGGSSTVGPGGDVHWSIAGLGEGAMYTVTFEGQTVSGTKQPGDEAPSGVFKMPDLGAEATQVNVYVQVS